MLKNYVIGVLTLFYSDICHLNWKIEQTRNILRSSYRCCDVVSRAAIWLAAKAPYFRSTGQQHWAFLCTLRLEFTFQNYVRHVQSTCDPSGCLCWTDQAFAWARPHNTSGWAAYTSKSYWYINRKCWCIRLLWMFDVSAASLLFLVLTVYCN